MLLFRASNEPAELEIEFDREETCLLSSSAFSDICRDILCTVWSTLCKVTEFAKLICLQASLQSSIADLQTLTSQVKTVLYLYFLDASVISHE